MIISIPHGSSLLTTEMEESKRHDVSFPNNDWFLNELYSFLPKLNVTTLSASYSRYVIDLNRDIKNKYIQGEYTRSLIYHKTTFGREIYSTPLSEEVILKRIEAIYQPYHDCMIFEINRSIQQRNRAFLFDLHSFYFQSTADVVLGTCQGTSCSRDLVDVVYGAFVSEGFTVKVDEKGLTGGHIVSHYGSLDHVEVIQVELRYTAYIEDRIFGEEEVTRKNAVLFREAQGRLLRVFERIQSVIDLMG